MLSNCRSLKRYFLYFVGALIFLVYVSPCLAIYNFEGVPEKDELVEVKSGTVKGGLYVDGGKGLGQTPYVQEFNIPGDSVTWARVYVGVWGGNEEKTGTLDLSVNGKGFESLDLKGKADKGDNEDQNPAIYCTGHGVYWVAYDLDTLSTGPVKVEAETEGEIDGRIYGIVLVAVYEDKESQEVKYWVEEGNVNLHGEGWSGKMASTHDEAYVDFSGRVDVDKYRTANLAVVYLCSSPGLADSLYFNDEQLADGENYNDIADSKNYFDLKFFDVLDFLEEDNNKLKFQRDDEDYLHPVLTTLCLSTEEEGDSDLIVSELNLPVLYAGEDNTIKATIKNIGKDPAYGFQAALYADDKIVSTASVSSLSNGRSKTIDFNWKPNSGGEQFLKVYVDHTNKKKELCEVNNWNTPLLVKIIDMNPPEIKIESPKDGSLVGSGYLTVSGTVKDTNQNLTVDVNGHTALLSDGSWSAEVPVAPGSNKIVVSAVDGANNTGKEVIVVSGTSSRSDVRESSGRRGEREPVNQTIETENTNNTLAVFKNKQLETQVIFPRFYAGIGFISAIFVLKSQYRRKQA